MPAAGPAPVAVRTTGPRSPAHPRPGPVAARRLAVVRAAVLTGGYAVLSVEVLGAFSALTTPGVAAAWLLYAAGAGLWLGRASRWAALRRWRPALAGLRRRWAAAGRASRWLLGTAAALAVAELFIALLAEPNNFDSQTYHLPKVEHWVAQRDLELWPTAIHRQVTIPPGAEYLLLHLRLLTGGDALANLVQWAAMLGCLLLAARITAQLGGGGRAQAVAVFLVATTPMVALQATSTQTDLVTAAWVGCVATLALDGSRRLTGTRDVLLLGTATGLVAVTKSSGLFAVGPLLVLWGLGQLWCARRRRPGGPDGKGWPVLSWPATVARVGTAAVLVLVAATVLVGPFLLRIQAEFGHPLGPPRLRESIPAQRHDPPAVLVNLLRIGHTALDTPFGPARAATATGIEQVAAALGVDPQDRRITFGQTTFPVPAWYPDEDRVAFPLVGTLALLGTATALLRPGRLLPGRSGGLRAYAAVVVSAGLLHVVMIKWQPWGNRLILYALVLACPLAAIWVDSILRRRAGTGGGGRDGAARRAVAALAVSAVLATSALAGALAISYGFPRRLVGTGSLLTTEAWDTRFLRRPAWAEQYRWAAEAVTASGARRIGILEGNDDWEYPWWLLLADDGAGGRRELVALRSVLPHRPAADPASVDAIVCTGERDECAEVVPAGWRLEFRDYVGYALPR